MQLRNGHNYRHDCETANDHDAHRQVAICPRRMLAPGVFSEQIGEAASQSAPDRGDRAEQADDATSSNGPRADVKNVRLPDVVWAHLAYGNRAWCERRRSVLTKEFDGWNKNQIREHTAGAHDRCDARPDDVADSEQSRLDCDGDRAAFERRAENFLRRVFPRLQRAHSRLVEKADPQTAENDLAPARDLSVDNLCVCRAVGFVRDRE